MRLNYNISLRTPLLYINFLWKNLFSRILPLLDILSFSACAHKRIGRQSASLSNAFMNMDIEWKSA